MPFTSAAGPAEIKGATILSPVDEHGLRAFMLEVYTPNETIKVRIARDDNTDFFVEKVNSLVGKAVDIRIYRSPWISGEKSGIVNYLQSIEESAS